MSECKHPKPLPALMKVGHYMNHDTKEAFQANWLDQLEMAGRVIYVMGCGCSVPRGTIVVFPGGERMAVAYEVSRAENERHFELMGWSSPMAPPPARFYVATID